MLDKTAIRCHMTILKSTMLVSVKALSCITDRPSFNFRLHTTRNEHVFDLCNLLSKVAALETLIIIT